MIAATGWQALYALPTRALAGDAWDGWDTSDHVRLDVVMWEEVSVSTDTPVITGWVVHPYRVGHLAGYLTQAPNALCMSSTGHVLRFVRYIRITDEVTYTRVEGSP